MKNAFYFAFFLLLFWGIFYGLQHKSIYDNTLGIISKNWVNENDVISKVGTPYQQLNNEKYIKWDGVHYSNIKNYGYSMEKSGGDFIFAFFPLFPFLWKILNLPPVGILFVNYLLFSLSVIILYRMFLQKENLTSYSSNILVLISLPSIIVFLMPYTEAVFLISILIGFYGLYKNKYFLFFIGFLLASLSRSSFIFLILSIVLTELFFYLKNKSFSLMLKNSFLRSLPLILGTLFVYIIQSFYEGGNSIKFITAQKYWDRKFSIPTIFNDWSKESFSINVGVLVLLFIPLLGILIKLIWNQLGSAVKKPVDEKNSSILYLQVLSLFYLMGMFLFVLFFQNGNLHGLYRYVLCSPFLWLLLFSSVETIKKITLTYRGIAFGLLTILSICTLGLLEYSRATWDFSDLGLFILISALFFWLFQDLSEHLSYKIGLFISILINAIWTTYLFNTYIAGGWIFV